MRHLYRVHTGQPFRPSAVDLGSHETLLRYPSTHLLTLGSGVLLVRIGNSRSIFVPHKRESQFAYLRKVACAFLCLHAFTISD